MIIIGAASHRISVARKIKTDKNMTSKPKTMIADLMTEPTRRIRVLTIKAPKNCSASKILPYFSPIRRQGAKIVLTNNPNEKKFFSQPTKLK